MALRPHWPTSSPLPWSPVPNGSHKLTYAVASRANNHMRTHMCNDPVRHCAEVTDLIEAGVMSRLIQQRS